VCVCVCEGEIERERGRDGPYEKGGSVCEREREGGGD
jgi:hypothetical protein